ncbi:hypothetical protein RHMOL_Rhmol02G0020800 [Rhododendron molle]|uniref:Uncharacterized protein n=1 Tax=Rhododendron molle TaxID=49168 RepID=A0ACC0PM03_RHOML|nr:hypothetical protein RHMOL_Rhmol02G0020800 [Rhododendron molle]
MSPPKHDHALLSSLVEHYDVSERCFVFNDVKLPFGLEDVWHIIGLPVDGEAVTGVEGNPIQLSEEYLRENLCEGNRGAIKLDTLKKKFQKVEELERELKGRYEAETLLHQKVEELERKLKEKQHNSEPALHQKVFYIFRYGYFWKSNRQAFLP